jgi:hypothetical protein
MENLAHNAQKVIYLCSAYPEKTLKEIIALLAMPAIDINAAIFYCQKEGWLGEPDGETGYAQVLKTPEKWDFGPEEKALEELLVFAFEQLNAKEKDLEEFFVSQWTTGYPAQDVLVAVKRLLETKKLHEYEIEDGEEKYIFYTLYKNRDKLYGRQAFKKDPLANSREGGDKQ